MIKHTKHHSQLVELAFNIFFIKNINYSKDLLKLIKSKKKINTRYGYQTKIFHAWIEEL